MNHGLSPKTLDEIKTALAHFPEVEKAVLYGSRAKGKHRRGSDIDLALLGWASITSFSLDSIVPWTI